jgi:hypothetical protein
MDSVPRSPLWYRDLRWLSEAAAPAAPVLPAFSGHSAFDCRPAWRPRSYRRRAAPGSDGEDARCDLSGDKSSATPPRGATGELARCVRSGDRHCATPALETAAGSGRRREPAMDGMPMPEGPVIGDGAPPKPPPASPPTAEPARRLGGMRKPAKWRGGVGAPTRDLRAAPRFQSFCRAHGSPPDSAACSGALHHEPRRRRAAVPCVALKFRSRTQPFNADRSTARQPVADLLLERYMWAHGLR